MNVYIAATVTGYRDAVMKKIKEVDPAAKFERSGTCTFWVATKLTRFSIECIDGVTQVYPSILKPEKLIYGGQN
jgi:hypothetical protein